MIKDNMYKIRKKVGVPILIMNKIICINSVELIMCQKRQYDGCVHRNTYIVWVVTKKKDFSIALLNDFLICPVKKLDKF